jgi:hypothetical protein
VSSLGTFIDILANVCLADDCAESAETAADSFCIRDRRAFGGGSITRKCNAGIDDARGILWISKIVFGKEESFVACAIPVLNNSREAIRMEHRISRVYG